MVLVRARFGNIGSPTKASVFGLLAAFVRLSPGITGLRRTKAAKSPKTDALVGEPILPNRARTNTIPTPPHSLFAGRAIRRRNEANYGRLGQAVSAATEL